ncbi:hypothetical protein [Flavobacterium sp. WC2509]|uniref:hypothetical protein n=1 Tax=Flavobacterium sp. WC2509 TaxID=3461406 RepID=UPI004043CCBD
MKYIIVLHLFIISSFSYSQNFQVNKIVVDKNTKSPLESVLIFNESDNSTTNADGKFVFVSQKNEINLNLLGYEAIKTTFDKLKTSNDTIFMQIKATQLEEVVVSNTPAFMKKVFEKFKDNYLPNYTINFFLRNTLKKNNTTIVLQDVYAKQNKNNSKKKKTTIEILNMRKISLFEKKDHIGFKFPALNNFINIVGPLYNKCSFTEIPFNDSNFKKILFETIEKNEIGQIWKGYFIINRNDYAIVEYSLNPFSDPKDIPYKEMLLSSGKYRSVEWTKWAQFTKDKESNKYYLNNLKLEEKIELIANEKTFYLNLNMNYFVTNCPTKEEIKPNFSADKDVFKADFSYSKDFWDNQNQLPLTKELELFLKSVVDKKDKTKEYRIIGNF